MGRQPKRCWERHSASLGSNKQSIGINQVSNWLVTNFLLNLKRWILVSDICYQRGQKLTRLGESWNQLHCIGLPGHILRESISFLIGFSCNFCVFLRQGHLQTVVLLILSGADPTILDGEGLATRKFNTTFCCYKPSIFRLKCSAPGRSVFSYVCGCLFDSQTSRY